MARARRMKARIGAVIAGTALLVAAGIAYGIAPASADAATRTRITQIAAAELNNGARNHEINECNYYTGQVQHRSSACPAGWGVNEWCANFVEYVWKTAGNIDLRRIDGYAESLKQYGIANGTWHPAGSGYAPRPGDAVVYKDDADSDSRAEHVGVVYSYSGGRLVTIEGNWNERVSRRVNPSRVQGFTAPRFGGGTKPGPGEEPPALVGGSKDFTGDGIADVLGRHPNGDLYLYPAGSTGIPYATKVKIHSGWNTNNWLYAASVDYAAGVDLVGRNAAGDLLLYSNTGKAGTGMFDPTPTKIGSGWNVMTWLAVADVNGDKLGDMIGRRRDGNVFVYPNTGKAGTGTFGAPYDAGSGWNVMNAMLVADYTGDGRADLVGRDKSGKLWLYPASVSGSTDTTPTYSWRAQIGSGWHTLNGLSVAHTNNDGLPDMIARDHAGKLWRYTNSGKGLLATYAGSRAYVGSGWHTITAIS